MPPDLGPEDFDELQRLPITNRDQSCAFCGGDRPRFVHPLARDRIAFRVFGKGWTLPTFWTVCDQCEASIEGGNDAKLRSRMTDRGTDEELAQASLTAFRAADLGPSTLIDAVE
ncbi:MAG TPA: hypothetical protein VMH41_09010 [Mycobacteriales bacterium]|nr:hypothetical protein [Mycobacteriales bacterium]